MWLEINPNIRHRTYTPLRWICHEFGHHVHALYRNLTDNKYADWTQETNWGHDADYKLDETVAMEVTLLLEEAFALGDINAF